MLRVGQRERRHSPRRLAGNPQRLTARGEDRQAGRGAEQRLGELGARGNHVLAVVEHQEHPAIAQLIRQRLDQRSVRRLPDVEDRRDRLARPASGSASGARSTNHTPSGKPSSTCRATSSASRVLPHPPAPVSVNSRVDGSSRASSAISRWRPMKLVSGAGRLCVRAFGWLTAAPTCAGRWLARHGREWRIEDEASPCHRLQQLTVVVSQRLANLADALGQRVIGDERVRPDGSKQIVLGDQPPVVFVEVDQYLKRLGSQPDLAPAAQQASTVQADRDMPRGNPFLEVRSPFSLSPNVGVLSALCPDAVRTFGRPIPIVKGLDYRARHGV